MPRSREFYELFSRHLTVTIKNRSVSISYELPTSITLGSEIRERTLRQKFKARLNRWRPESKTIFRNYFNASFSVKNIAHIQSALDDLDLLLDSFIEEKLTPKIVEEILQITSLERIRWSKDGRLPTSGFGTFSKGRQLIQFPLYPVAGIVKIASNHALIEKWRKIDSTIKQ